jgi:effector-binding domain-containing protein
MKKIILIILTSALVIAVGIYFIIPSKLEVTNQVTIEASDVIISRFLIQKSGWDKWWPGTKINDDQFSYNGVQYHIIKTTNSGVNLSIQKNNLKLNGEISYLPNSDYLVKITMYAAAESSTNPIQKITNYIKINDLKDQTAIILHHLKIFLEDEKNAYNYKIYINKIEYPILLTTTIASKSYPDMRHVYETIEELREQAKVQGVKEKNFPMLNIHKTDDKQYEITLAIPIDRAIAPTGKSYINNMVLGGNLLVADVKGGPNTISNAFAQVKIFMKDHRLISPAMPFESLITDRYVEKDTSKWMTKIYYPIF